MPDWFPSRMGLASTGIDKTKLLIAFAKDGCSQRRTSGIARAESNLSINECVCSCSLTQQGMRFAVAGHPFETSSRHSTHTVECEHASACIFSGGSKLSDREQASCLVKPSLGNTTLWRFAPERNGCLVAFGSNLSEALHELLQPCVFTGIFLVHKPGAWHANRTEKARRAGFDLTRNKK